MAVFTKSRDDLVAYFDESMGEGPLPMTAVAGYLFEPYAYFEFEKGMKHLLRENKICYFRMADTIKLRGSFAKFQGLDSDLPEKIGSEQESDRVPTGAIFAEAGVSLDWRV
jgi:hypothetical protein